MTSVVRELHIQSRPGSSAATASLPQGFVGDRNAQPSYDAELADKFIDDYTSSRSTQSVAKRGLDIIAAASMFFLLLPGLLAIAIAIKLTSPGPVLFRQERYGLYNRRFVIFKFRTMYIDQCDESGVKQTCEGDERVTKVGKLLRRFNLDELPQLLNVVRGEMSIVGPRPHVPGMLAGGVLYEMLVPDYFHRHRVKPGLTGLAQARGFRGSTVDSEAAKARIDHDLQYIRDWSFALDLRLIVETAWSEIFSAGKGI